MVVHRHRPSSIGHRRQVASRCGSSLFRRRFSASFERMLRAAFPGQFVTIVGGSVALAVVGALALALARVREGARASATPSSAARSVARSPTASRRGPAYRRWTLSNASTSSSTAPSRSCSTARGGRWATRPRSSCRCSRRSLVGTLRRVAAMVHPEPRRRSPRRVPESRRDRVRAVVRRRARAAAEVHVEAASASSRLAQRSAIAAIGSFAAFVNAVHRGYLVVELEERSNRITRRRASAALSATATS